MDQVADPLRERIWNDGERIVPGYWRASDTDMDVHFRRYAFAAQNVIGAADAVVDWGCGVGYGAGLVPDRQSYLGIELDRETVMYARARYGRYGRFEVGNLLEAEVSGTVGLCFEVLEHLPDAPADAVRVLLAKTPRLLISVPYLEGAGANPHHVHFGLSEGAFVSLTDVLKVPYYQAPDGQITSLPAERVANLLVLFQQPYEAV
jgi:SAM-dependent methyltransferase